MVREDGSISLETAQAVLAMMQEALAATDMDVDNAALFLLMLPGRDIEALVEDLPMPEEEVRLYWERAVKNNIRVGDKVNARWLHPVEGGIAFLLDVLVIQDVLVRSE